MFLETNKSDKVKMNVIKLLQHKVIASTEALMGKSVIKIL